jgi:hypothetical protein
MSAAPKGQMGAGCRLQARQRRERCTFCWSRALPQCDARADVQSKRGRVLP